MLRNYKLILIHFDAIRTYWTEIRVINESFAACWHVLTTDIFSNRSLILRIHTSYISLELIIKLYKIAISWNIDLKSEATVDFTTKRQNVYLFIYCQFNDSMTPKFNLRHPKNLFIVFWLTWKYNNQLKIDYYWTLF